MTGPKPRHNVILYLVLGLPIAGYHFTGAFELMVLVYLWLISVAIFGHLNNE